MLAQPTLAPSGEAPALCSDPPFCADPSSSGRPIRFLARPIRLLLITTLAIFATELTIMWLFHIWNPRIAYDRLFTVALMDATLLSILMFPILYTILFYPLLKEIQKRIQVEVQLHNMPRRIIQAQEAERCRVSREIHDELEQSLAALKLLFQSVSTDSGGKLTLEARSRIIRLLDGIIESSGTLARELRSTVLDNMGLTAALKQMVEDWHQAYRLRINLRVPELRDVLSREAELNVYRIIQEAIINVAKHAEATSVSAEINVQDSQLRMVIADDGKGFELDDVHSGDWCSGLGLKTMRERVHLVGGSLTISSKPGHGTVVTVEIPVDNPSYAGAGKHTDAIDSYYPG